MPSSGDADPHGGRGSSALHRRPAPAGAGAGGAPPLTPGEVHAPQPWPPPARGEEEPAGEGRAGSAGVGAGAEGPAERPEVEAVPEWVPRERLEKRKADRGPAVGGWGARRECGRHRSGWARARAERRGFAARVPLCLRETDLTAALPETLDKVRGPPQTAPSPPATAPSRSRASVPPRGSLSRRGPSPPLHPLPS